MLLSTSRSTLPLHLTFPLTFTFLIILYLSIPSSFHETVYLQFIQVPAVEPVPEVQPIDPPLKLSGAPTQALAWISESEKVCKRTFLIKLDPTAGFGSTLYLLALPGLTISRTSSYTPLIDDSSFNYGRLTDYFHPLSIPCTPPSDYATLPRVEYGRPGWEDADHIFSVRGGYDPHTVFSVDRYWNQNWIREDQVQGILEQDRGVYADEGIKYLPSDMTFSPALRPAYRAIYRSLSDLWRPNDQLLTDVEELVAETRGARRAGVPVLGAVLRLGDKRTEAGADPGPSAYANFPSYLSVALSQLSLLTTSPGTPPPGQPMHKPVLRIMSDDMERAMEGIKACEEAERFEIVPMLPGLEEVELGVGDDRREAAGVGGLAARGNGEGVVRRDDIWEDVDQPPSSLRKRHGHHQAYWNKLPLTQRIAAGRTLLRDMHYMAHHVDALAVSSASNVGRVLLVMSGEAKAYGWSGEGTGEGGEDMWRSNGGLIRSLDMRWIPGIGYDRVLLNKTSGVRY